MTQVKSKYNNNMNRTFIMEEVVTEAARPLLRLFFYIFRGILWLAWDLSVQTIGWSVGWCFLRIITVGNFPKHKISEQKNAPLRLSLLVEFLGIAIIGFITIVFYRLAFQ